MAGELLGSVLSPLRGWTADGGCPHIFFWTSLVPFLMTLILWLRGIRRLRGLIFGLVFPL